MKHPVFLFLNLTTFRFDHIFVLVWPGQCLPTCRLETDFNPPHHEVHNRLGARGQQTMGLPTQTETNLMLRTHSERSTGIILALFVDFYFGAR